MVTLNDLGLKILGIVREGPTAWRTPAEVAVKLGWDLERTYDALANLDIDGWLDVWELDEGPVVTLSPLSAQRLGVHLVESGPHQTLRWIEDGALEPPSTPAHGVCSTERGADFDFLIDPRPTPDQVMEMLESKEGDGENVLPFPTLLLGTSFSPWPGPLEVPALPERPCPVCGTAVIPLEAYCLCCDRWGRDKQLGDRAGRTRRPARSRMRNVPQSLNRSESLEQSERKKRKQKRQRRMKLRSEHRRNPSVLPPHPGIHVALGQRDAAPEAGVSSYEFAPTIAEIGGILAAATPCG